MDKLKFYNNIGARIATIANYYQFKFAIDAPNGTMLSDGTNQIPDYKFVQLSIYALDYEIEIWVSTSNNPAKVDIAIHKIFDGEWSSYIDSHEYLISYSFAEDENIVLTRWNNNKNSFDNSYPQDVLSLIESAIHSTFVAYQNAI
jgi:3-methyladenine DNA glycosylase AlkD